MKWRCLNDWMGYCKDQPNFGEKLRLGVYANRETCKSSPETCKKYLNNSELNQKEKVKEDK